MPARFLSLVTPCSKGWLIYWALHNWRTTTHTWTKGLLQFIMVADLNAITEWYAFPQRVEFEFDTSGSWGRGAWWETEWLQFQWPRQAMEHHYHLPWAMYIVAMMLCGPQWQDCARIQASCTSCSFCGSWRQLFRFKCQQVIYQELTIHWQDLLSHSKLPLFISKVS